MKRRRGRPWWGVAAIAILFIIGVAVWQWETVARLGIVATADAITGARVTFGRMTLGSNQAVFDDVRVTSARDEPIATIPRLTVAYDLGDWLRGTRLYGLRSIELESPHVTIIRRSDGTYNVPIPQLQANRAVAARPVMLAARVRNGSLDAVDLRPSSDDVRRLYVRALDVSADISTGARSRYTASLRYGESPDRLFPVAGRGDIDGPDGYVNQRWTARQLPIAAAVNFVAGSPSLRFLRGTLHGLDARYFGFSDSPGALRCHLAASATLAGARIALAGISKPIEDVGGPVDVYDDGLVTPRLDARLAGAPVTIGGGIYGIRSPRLRMAVRGIADAAVLRSAFTQAAHLPIQGLLRFALLVAGSTEKPVTWIALASPRLTYSGASVDGVDGLVAFDGREATVLGMRGAYRGLDLSARGRVGFQPTPGAVEVLLGVRSGEAEIPYVGAFLPGMSLRAAAVATADDPKKIAVDGAVWGSSPSASLGGVFNVDQHGVGTVGPLYLTGRDGSLYARVALDGSHRSTLGIAEARDLALPPLRGRFDGTIFGGQAGAGIGLGVAGRLNAAWGAANARGDLAFENGGLRGALFGDVGGEANFGATLAGTPQSPRVAGTVVVAGGRYRDFTVNGNAGLAYADGTLRVHDAAVAVGPLFAGVAGTIAGLSQQGVSAARYDLAAQLHSSDVAALAADLNRRTPWPIEGSVDADVRVRGAGTSPSFSGTVAAPEGSVNGLAFRDLRAGVTGSSRALSLTGGRVVVGSTAIALRGDTTLRATNVAIEAPHTDLSDFNDFFDTGDTFGGTGNLALAATLDGTRVAASSGVTFLSGARFRRLALGAVAARWQTHHGTIDSALAFGGPTGEVNLKGSVTPATMAVDMRANASAVDLATWLPMLGYSAPITGRLDAQTAVSGRYPDIALNLHAIVSDGTVGRMPVSLFDVNVSAAHGRGSIRSARVDLPSLSTTASGTFGLRRSDPIALAAHSTSPDFGAFLFAATGKKAPATGVLDSVLRIEGTAAAPRLRDTIAVQSLRYRELTIPRITAEIDADRHAVSVRNGEVDLTRGRVLASATVPIRTMALPKVAAGSGPISGSLRAQDVELSNFVALLPKGTNPSGRIDGEVLASGSLDAPQLNGTLSLRDAGFSGPMERSPFTGGVADLSFAGERAHLTSHAAVGGGTVSAEATAALASLRRAADSIVDARFTAANARLDMPGYFQGVLDANVSLASTTPTDPAVTGEVTVSNARIPLDAFLRQRAAGSGSGVPDISFSDVRIAAGPNVRVQSKNVDIGATGAIALSGTLATPRLAGSFRSTGGSLNFYRNFDLQSGEVRFDPSSGVIPDIDAVATTFVSDPPTAVRLNVTGPATQLNLALASEPSYSREQILGLLVGAQQFGAVRGVRSSGGQSFSAGAAAANVAFGQLNTLFTRNMLQPLSSSLAGTLGFNEVRLTSDIQTGVGVSAVKAFGKYVNAIFAQTFGYPKTQSITLEAHPNPYTGLRLTVFTAEGPTLLALQQPAPIGMDIMNLNPLTSLPPLTGTNGVTFSYQVKFP